MSNEELEKKYNEVVNSFVKSAEDSTFSKKDVIEIMKAYKHKEIMESYNQSRSKKRNMVILKEKVGSRLKNPYFYIQILLTYIFNLGALVLVNQYVYPDLLQFRASLFIIALVFTLIDQVLKSLLFFLDLITLTFHRIGLVSMAVYSLTFFLLSNIIENTITEIPYAKSIVVVMIVLTTNVLIDHINHHSGLYAHLIGDDELLDEDVEISDERSEEDE